MQLRAGVSEFSGSQTEAKTPSNCTKGSYQDLGVFFWGRQGADKRGGLKRAMFHTPKKSWAAGTELNFIYHSSGTLSLGILPHYGNLR